MAQRINQADRPIEVGDDVLLDTSLFAQVVRLSSWWDILSGRVGVKVKWPHGEAWVPSSRIVAWGRLEDSAP